MGSRPSPWSVVARFPATAAIVGITVLFFGLEYVFGGGTDLRAETRLGALRADRVVEHWELWRLVMPILLHHGPIHLLLNLLAFVQLGSLVEHLWGSRRLVLFYVASGTAASMASAAFNDAQTAVGASGAILGLAGVVLGASMFGDESARLLLSELRPRLRRAVALTLVIGIVFWFLNLVPIDNFAHIGGLVTGLILAAAYPDPLDATGSTPGGWNSEGGGIGFLAATGAVVVSIVLAFAHGPRALATLEIDTARLLAERVSRQPGELRTVLILPQMLDWYDQAHRTDQGLDVFRRAVDKDDSAFHLQTLASLLMTEAEEQKVDRDLAIRIALERWVAVDGNNPDALNALAWHLVTCHDPARRDPVAAERWSRESLQRIDGAAGTASTQRASFLDTLAEALFLQGRYAEALEAQHESVRLATELKMTQLPELAERLRKIQAAAG